MPTLPRSLAGIEFGPRSFRLAIAAEITLGFCLMLMVEIAMPSYWVQAVTKPPPVGQYGDPFTIIFLIAPLVAVLALLFVTVCLYFFVSWARYANAVLWIAAVPVSAYVHYENHAFYPELADLNWIIDILSNLFWASALFVLALSYSGRTSEHFRSEHEGSVISISS